MTKKEIDSMVVAVPVYDDAKVSKMFTTHSC